MYELYSDKYKEESRIPEKLWLYRQIFSNDFNLSFQVPRNDICDTCFKYSHMNDEEKLLQKEEQDAHMLRKDSARQKKNSIKVQQALDNEYHLAEFDLQAVCYCPKTNAKALFYRRKLAVYNLTVYNIDKKHLAICGTKQLQDGVLPKLPLAFTIIFKSIPMARSGIFFRHMRRSKPKYKCVSNVHLCGENIGHPNHQPYVFRIRPFPDGM